MHLAAIAIHEVFRSKQVPTKHEGKENRANSKNEIYKMRANRWSCYFRIKSDWAIEMWVWMRISERLIHCNQPNNFSGTISTGYSSHTYICEQWKKSKPIKHIRDMSLRIMTFFVDYQFEIILQLSAILLLLWVSVTKFFVIDFIPCRSRCMGFSK